MTENDEKGEKEDLVEERREKGKGWRERLLEKNDASEILYTFFIL